MSKQPWHKRFHDDALGGYMGLSLEERGAYTTLLDLLYQNGEPLLDNERYLAGWMQCSLRKYRALRDRLLDLGKIVRLDDGRLTNPRFDKEVASKAETSRKSAESGENGGKKSGEVRRKVKENNENSKRSLQKNEAISEAQKESKKEGGADAQPYAFVGRTIRIKPIDLERWQDSYSAIADWPATLTKADDYFTENPVADGKWYFRLSGWLKREHDDIVAKRAKNDLYRRAAARG